MTRSWPETVGVVMASPMVFAAYGICACTIVGLLSSLSILRWTVRQFQRNA